KLNQFLEYFTSVLKEGKDILYISFSSGLSGTYSASLLAAEHLKENFPQSKITCVDTLAASLGEGLLVYTAAKLKEQGKTLEEVQQWLLENRLNLVHLFTVDDLAFLKRGGRCSSLSAFVGTMLHIKPLLHVDDEGKLMPQEKIRTRKKLFEVMVERMAALAIEPEKQVVCISHGDDLAGAETLAELIKNKLGTQDFIINNVCPLVGSHSGPGTIALFFFGRHR
ncbi:MAG: DegV family protein, partial [Clostridiales bacterium]